MKEKNMKNFFSKFPPTSKATWLAKVKESLKGVELEYENNENLEVAPFYTREDLENISYLRNFHMENIDFQNSKYLENRPYIEVKNPDSANKKAIQSLKNGCGGILFDISEYQDISFLQTLLSDISACQYSLSFKIGITLKKFLNSYFAYIQSKNIPLDKLRGNIYAPYHLFIQVDKISQKAKNLHCFTIESDIKPVIERIGYLLSNAIKLINDLQKQGFSPQESIFYISFSYKLTNHYFLEIAALRAIRLLFSTIAIHYGLKQYTPKDLFIHTQTCIKEEKDNYQNILSNTIQTMSALIGGSNAITVLPHEKSRKENNEFAERIGRNIVNILREESHLDKVADPAAGSYFIEKLTDQIAEKSWEYFQKKLS